MSANPPAPADDTRTSRWSLPIVRVAGIEIRIHATFLILVALFAFGSSARGGPGVVGGLLWLAVIAARVVVHELAHSIVAIHRGATVREIVLLPIGGVSKLENLPETPRDEFAIAIAGPLASFGIAALGAAIAGLFGQSLLPVDLYGGPILHKVVWFNLIVGAFNLLPAFPLDGGRVLRSLLERRFDLERATRHAARIGRIVALAMMAIGIFADWWLVFIGVFVYFGAAAEEAATIVHIRLKGLRAKDVMLLNHVTAAELLEHDAPVVAPTADVEREVIPALTASPSHAVVVTESSRPIGVIREEDVEHLIDVHGPERTS